MKTDSSRPPEEVLAIFETLPDLYLVLSADLVTLFANQAYLRATHTQLDDILGRPILDVFPDTPAGNEIALVKESFQQVLSTRKPHHTNPLRYDLSPSQGSGRLVVRYWRAHNIPVLNEAGQIRYIIQRVHEVTEQVAATARQQAIGERQQQHQDQTEQQLSLLQNLLNQSPVAISLYQGPDQVVASANRLMCDILGHPAEQIIGYPLLEGVPELRGQGFEKLIQEVRTTGVPYRGREAPAQLLRNGQLKTTYYDFVYQPLRDDQDEIMGVLTVAVDVTEQVEARQQLEQVNSELEERVAARTQELTRINTDLDSFVYTASHDLKAPITNIQALLSMLRKKLPAETQTDSAIQKVLGMMEQSVVRFMHTITDMSEITRLQRQSDQPAESVDLFQVVEDVRLDLALLIEQSEAQLDIELDARPLIQFSPKHLRSVVYNLLSNAIKYRDPDRKPLVQLRCEATEDYYVLTVSDNGLGMDLSQDTKLFAMFRRLHNHVEGTGVGLYIVKKVVENAGGKITVDSQLGQGTTFTVYFKR